MHPFQSPHDPRQLSLDSFRRPNVRLRRLAALTAIVLVAGCARLTPWQDLNDRAVARFEQGDYFEASALARKALREAKRRFPQDHPNVATALNNLGQVYQAQRHYAQALALLDRALAIRRSILPEDHPKLIESTVNLASCLILIGNYGHAEVLLRSALASAENTYGPAHAETANVLSGLTTVYTKLRRKDEAAECEARAQSILEAIPQ